MICTGKANTFFGLNGESATSLLISVVLSLIIWLINRK
jgi:hypothetical protein